MEQALPIVDAEALSTPTGVELLRFAKRVCGDPQAAKAAVSAGLRARPANRITAIAAVARECLAASVGVDPRPPTELPAGLAQRVAAELDAANLALPERQRVVLALRDLLRLSYTQIGQVMGIEQPAVASLLARGRLALRDRMRGGGDPPSACLERAHTLRLLVRRLDSEPVRAVDEDWLWDHLPGCRSCERAQLRLSEAAFLYRSWGRV